MLYPHTSDDRRTAQRGASSLLAAGAIAALGVVFLIVFLIGNSGSGPAKPATTTTDDSNQTAQPADGASFIRIPEDFNSYNNEAYGFTLAYPKIFGNVGEIEDPVPSSIKPLVQIGTSRIENKFISGTNIRLTGQLLINVYSKDDLKIAVNQLQLTVAPTTTGNDTTWKIVNKGEDPSAAKIGDAYNVNTITSQTKVKIFDFGLNISANYTLSRLVFVSGDQYVLVALPDASHGDGTKPLSDAEYKTYLKLTSDIASTIRLIKADSDNPES